MDPKVKLFLTLSKFMTEYRSFREQSPVLQFYHLAIDAGFLEQLLMRGAGGDPAFLHNGDAIDAADGRETMGDDE